MVRFLVVDFLVSFIWLEILKFINILGRFVEKEEFGLFLVIVEDFLLFFLFVEEYFFDRIFLFIIFLIVIIGSGILFG